MKGKQPWHDWILLPLLSLLTVGMLIGLTELIARRMFSRSKTSMYDCLVLNDPSTGIRAIPSSVCREKPFEGQTVEYKFNRCGHRAGMECGQKSRGVYKVVLVGSSGAMGDMIDREKTFAALLPIALTRQSGRKVELYNEGMLLETPSVVAMRLKEALVADPDMILWALSAWDIESAAPAPQHLEAPHVNQGFMGETKRRLMEALTAKSVPEMAKDLSQTAHQILETSRTAVLVRHFLYENQGLYVKSSLAEGDKHAGFLRAEPNAEWTSNLRQFDEDVATIARGASVAHVSFAVVFVPSRAQAAMISMGEWPSGYDPYKIDFELRNIIEGHGGTYVSILPGYRTIPNPERGYFPVDGHPNSDGHAVVARLLAKQLTSGIVPALTATHRPQVTTEE